MTIHRRQLATVAAMAMSAAVDAVVYMPAMSVDAALDEARSEPVTKDDILFTSQRDRPADEQAFDRFINRAAFGAAAAVLIAADGGDPDDVECLTDEIMDVCSEIADAAQVLVADHKLELLGAYRLTKRTPRLVSVERH